ncbi:hypothetical protein MIND_01041300 [Mycena indigotica]|uniref:Phosphatidylinositol N-acetylglucosaminyltransferase subunit H conserved domain-containing protein n=1 Tax=Mycena indigotica TaxID=2126181 RepID=A0A8H6SAB3_9AGAR|nr:uncharacterized protein MIND_01041300 [Mycena indigotica]KAF7295031.1 hypothetical protein MIND_01041300 [Mycena indigotica]
MNTSQPQLVILRQGGLIEYRVENWRLSRDGSDRVVWGVTGWQWYYALIPLIVSILWPRINESLVYLTAVGLALTGFAYRKCTQVLWESVLFFPFIGIQLETHRGLPWFAPLTIDRQFIPLGALEDFIINEGLHGWNVRYYAAALTSTESGAIRAHVAFPNILPHFPVLLEVYRGVQRDLSNAV